MSFALEYQTVTDNAPTEQPRPRQQQGSACDACRRKKLRCDRKQPSCMACVAARVTCVMRSSCPPRGPKKGHLNELRNQILALETRLNEQEQGSSEQRSQSWGHTSSNEENDSVENAQVMQVRQKSPSRMVSLTPLSMDLPPWSASTSNLITSTATMDPMSEDISRAMRSPEIVPVSLHLTAITCSDLDQLYFDRVHGFAPMIQRFRYTLWSKHPSKTRIKMCLQYSMWTLAATLSSQFQFLGGELYKEARQSLDALEMENHKMCIEHVQAWLLLSLYEFMADLYHRGLVSVGRAFRLIHLMRLHEIDNKPLSRAQDDLIEIESSRRTFWVAYMIDRFTSAQDNLPLAINEKEIRTRLPAPHCHFMSGRPYTMRFLSEVVSEIGSKQSGNSATDNAMCPFAQSIIIASVCGSTLSIKQQLVSQRAHQGLISEFYLQYGALSTFLTARIKVLSMQITSNSEHPDVLLLFSALSAYMTLLMLYEMAEAIPQGTDEAHTLLHGHEQRSLNTIQELDALILLLNQVNSFQMHPFTPMALLSSAQYCLSHMGSNGAYSKLVVNSSRALEGLKVINNLAQTSLQALGIGAPISTM